MKKSKKSLMLLPLIAICLSGCYTIIPEDAPEVNEEEFIPEGSYVLPDEGLDDEPETPDNPDNPDDNPETPGEETPTYSYQLEIANKDTFTNINIDVDNPENNTYIEDYSLYINLYTLTDGVITNTELATANDVSITSSDPSVVDLDGLTLIPQNKSGTTTISVYWFEHSEATDSFTIDLNYKAHEVILTYEYKLVINNKETLLSQSWTTADNPRDLDVSVFETILKDGTVDSYTELESPSIVLSQENLTEGDSKDILLIEGLSVTPKNPGSVRLTASWLNGEYYEQDYLDIIVSEAYYQGDYNLTITDPETFGGTDESPWILGTSRELDVTLSYSDYAYSDNSLYDTYEIKASIDDVTISVYGVREGEVVESADDDLTYYSLDGEIMISPVAANYDHYLVVVAWTIHPEATDYVYVHTEEPTTTYAMTIINADDIGATWKYDDSATRTLQYSINQTTQGETTSTDKDLYKESILAWTYPSGYVSATDNGDGESITLELLKEPIDNVTVTVYVMWSEHTSAIGYVELDLYQYTYSISITNAVALQASWSLEDNETRDVEYEITRDNTTLTELGSSYVEITSSDTGLASVDGTKVSAISEGNPTISATLYNEDGVVLATDTVLLSIDDVVKATSVSLTESSIEFTNSSDTKEISATVYGLNNREATDQTVTWEADNNGIVLSGEGNTITIGVTGYNISGTLTCASANGVGVATCSVTIGAEPKNPVAVQTPIASDIVITNPDDNGVYVLGTKESAPHYIVSDNGFSTTTTYNDASAVRVISGEQGYLLEVGDKYITNNSGTFALSSEGSEFTIDSNGLINDNSYKLCLTDNGPTWSANEDMYLYLLDINFEYTTVMTSNIDNVSFYFAADSDGTLEYWTGSVSSSHGVVSTSISEAAQITLERYDDATATDAEKEAVTGDASNAYYIKYGSNYLYGKDSGSSHNVYCNSTRTVSYYNQTEDYFEATDTTRFLAYGGSDMRTYAAGGDYPPFRLYAVEMPNIDVKGISLSASVQSIESGDSFIPHVTFYPSCINDKDNSDVSMAQTGGTGSVDITSGTGLVRGVNAGDVSIAATYNDTIVSNTLTFTVTEKEGSTGTPITETEKFTTDDLIGKFPKDSDGNKYQYGSGSGDSAIVGEITDGTVWDFGYYSVTWTQGSAGTSTRFWTGNQIRIYGGASFTVTPNDGVDLDSVVVTATSNASSLSVSAEEALSSLSGTVFTITPLSGNAVTISRTGTSGNTQITEFSFTYTYYI